MTLFFNQAQNHLIFIISRLIVNKSMLHGNVGSSRKRGKRPIYPVTASECYHIRGASEDWAANGFLVVNCVSCYFPPGTNLNLWKHLTRTSIFFYIWETKAKVLSLLKYESGLLNFYILKIFNFRELHYKLHK